MASIVYTILFVISFAMLIGLIAQYKNKVSVFYPLLFVSVTISNFGYMQIAAAGNLESAVYANQTIYLGGCFSPFFLMMCIADLCKVNVPKYVQRFILCYSFALFAFVSTIGLLPWYYVDVSFVRENGVGRLIKEYGPLHTLYPVYVLAMSAAALWMIIHAFQHKKDVSYITSALLLVSMLISVTVYIVEKSFDLSVEILPFAYIVSMGGCLFLLKRISMYEITVISANSMVESLAYGFVLVGNNGTYLGCDEAAKYWFPELKDIPIDTVIKAENTDLLKQIGAWLRGEDDRERVFIEQNDLILEVKHSILKEKKNRAVHCVYLSDDTQQQQYTRLVQQYNENLEKDVEAKTKKLRKIQSDIIISMASIVENRDSNTGGHIARTSDVVRIFVNYLQERGDFPQLTEKTAHCIVKAAPLHDFGKIAIPDMILNKPGKFTDAEYEVMKQHSAKGAVVVARILQNSEDDLFKNIAVNVAHYHHEKWNGSGYPTGISGEEIPFEARVMALADVFDALVSKRVYKESLDYDTAFRIIEESCGSHFDPVLCRAFLERREQLEALYSSYKD